MAVQCSLPQSRQGVHQHLLQFVKTSGSPQCQNRLRHAASWAPRLACLRQGQVPTAAHPRAHRSPLCAEAAGRLRRGAHVHAGREVWRVSGLAAHWRALEYGRRGVRALALLQDPARGAAAGGPCGVRAAMLNLAHLNLSSGQLPCGKVLYISTAQALYCLTAHNTSVGTVLSTG